MTQLILWILALLASWDTVARAVESEKQLLAIVQLRRQLLIDASEARLTFCQEAPKSGSTRLLWRSQDRWVPACSDRSGMRGPPRYWRIEARLKYGMLFLLELPITVSIVILA